MFYWNKVETDLYTIRNITSLQDRTAILGGIPPIFRSFSADFPPKMVPRPCYELKH